MDRDRIIDVLRRNADKLRAKGVQHAGLFGSLARGEAKPESDIDILIELDPNFSFTVFSYVGLKSDIEQLFRGRVDVVNRDALKPHLRPPVAADVLYAF